MGYNFTDSPADGAVSNGYTWNAAKGAWLLPITDNSSSGGTVDLVAAYGIDNTGATVVTTALQTAINTVWAAGYASYLPAGVYNLGAGALTIPVNGEVILNKGATLRRTAESGSSSGMIRLSSGARLAGGTVEDTHVGAQSSTSQTLSAGTKVFTVAAGLTPVNYVRARSRADKTKIIEGPFVSYSGTTLTMNATFFNGTGSAADWDIFGLTCGIELFNTSDCIVENVAVTGPFYVAISVNAWNDSAGSPGNFSSRNVLRNCVVTGHLNRGIYLYGSCVNNLIDGCLVNGQGQGAYGININPGNATGSANACLRNVVTRTKAFSLYAHGFAVAEFSQDTVFSDCHADTTYVGFLVEVANSGVLPVTTHLIGCTARACSQAGFNLVAAQNISLVSCIAVYGGYGFLMSGAGATQYCSWANCMAQACSADGFLISAASARLNFDNCMAISCAGAGVNLVSGNYGTQFWGRSYANTGGNVVGTSASGSISVLTT
jgi:parallel beta-helix repeat protein